MRLNLLYLLFHLVLLSINPFFKLSLYLKQLLVLLSGCSLLTFESLGKFGEHMSFLLNPVMYLLFDGQNYRLHFFNALIDRVWFLPEAI